MKTTVETAKENVEDQQDVNDMNGQSVIHARGLYISCLHSIVVVVAEVFAASPVGIKVYLGCVAILLNLPENMFLQFRVTLPMGLWCSG